MKDVCISIVNMCLSVHNAQHYYMLDFKLFSKVVFAILMFMCAPRTKGAALQGR